MTSEAQKRYKLAHPERPREASRRWRDRNPDKVREMRLLYRYGITIADFEFLFTKQGRRCGICGCSDPGPKGWVVDHVHVPGFFDLPAEIKRLYIRGILCNGCNSGFGLLKEDPEILKSALVYVVRPLRLPPTTKKLQTGSNLAG